MPQSVPFRLSAASQGSAEEPGGAEDAAVDALVVAVALAAGLAAETPITHPLHLMRVDLLGPSTTILLDLTALSVAGAEAASGVKR